MRSHRRFGATALVVAGLVFCSAARALAQAPASERSAVLLDADLGSGVDDAFALALILASPELELRGVTTVGSDPQVRALMACRFLTATGRRHTPVAAGGDPQPAREIGGLYQYYYHPDVLFNRTTRPQKDSAVEFLYARLKAQPGKLTLVATGPLTNLARLITARPDCQPWIRRIVLVGGEPANQAETAAASGDNLRAEIEAAQTVFASGIPLVVIPNFVTAELKLDQAGLQRVFSPGTPLTQQVQAMYQLWDRPAPVLAAPLAVALCLDERFCDFQQRHLTIDDRGRLQTGEETPNARLATAVRGAEFLKWYADRIASCLPPARRPSQLVSQGGMPYRVHVAEDYDTDIERRWWMSGKAETGNLPQGSLRACRGVLTHDFDDLLGNPKAMYTAVIFNPVPGPPMGKNTRLSFRYWLKGSDSLRVQIYSLTNGYHRHLVLTGLTQGQWQPATVDMTQARRPDGTGGPLSEGERIDDIQFYVEPTAELLIDDIVLYDAAEPNQQRPFPKRILFTGWFDSGKQGKEWPGEFAIAPQQGYFWHAAQSVPQSDAAAGWIRLHLRGGRALGDPTHLSFRYHLTGADKLRVRLASRGTPLGDAHEAVRLVQGRWAQTTVDLSNAGPSAAGLRKGEQADEIQFLLPAGAELLVDDVLLYEPGRN
jgi:inosine-uridine nucleoside N-ribohydrolase